MALGRQQRPDCTLGIKWSQSPGQIDPSSVSESINPCREYADFAVNCKKLCKQKHAWTIASTVLISARKALRKIRHLAARIPNTFSIVLLALETHYRSVVSHRVYQDMASSTRFSKGKISSPTRKYGNSTSIPGVLLPSGTFNELSSKHLPMWLSLRTPLSLPLPYCPISTNVKQYLASQITKRTRLKKPL